VGNGKDVLGYGSLSTPIDDGDRRDVGEDARG
jgi:hypothetical protein